MTPLMRKFFSHAGKKNNNPVSKFDQTKYFMKCFEACEAGFFDVTPISRQVMEVSGELGTLSDSQQDFLDRIRKPFPLTWLEFSDLEDCLAPEERELPHGVRTAFVVLDDPFTGTETAFTVFDTHATHLESETVLDTTWDEVGHSVDAMMGIYGSYRKLVMATCWLLNTTGSVEMERHPTTRLKARGIPTKWANRMTDHHTLHLCIDGVRIDRAVTGPNGVSGVMPYHLVRGHLHSYWTRKGLIKKYVEPFWRGNPEVGTVTKSYEVNP